MMHSERIEQARAMATRLHEGQTRKGSGVPYITHPLAVMEILNAYSSDEDVLVAALLHDTLEDTDYTPEQLLQDFGERVHRIVMGVTIPEMLDGTYTSMHRTLEGYRRNLQSAPDESALIAAADKLHNFTSVIEEYALSPERFMRDFPATSLDRLASYGQIVAELAPRIPAALAERLLEVWGAYALFIETALRHEDVLEPGITV